MFFFSAAAAAATSSRLPSSRCGFPELWQNIKSRFSSSPHFSDSSSCCFSPRSDSIFEIWSVNLWQTTHEAAHGAQVALAEAPQRIPLILAVAAVFFFLAVAAVEVDAAWRYAVCIQYYGTVLYLYFLEGQTDNACMPPDENITILIQRTIRFWTSLTPS